MTSIRVSIALVIALLSGGSLLAQEIGNNLLMARLERELEITDEYLDRAAALVKTSDSPTANLSLNGAFKLQEWAKRQYVELRRQFRLELHGMAMTATHKAREQAKVALAASRQVEQYEGTVLRRLEQARERLERAGEVLAEIENGSLQAIHTAAEDNLTKAWQYYRQNQYRPAIKLADQVEKAAKKILDTANGVIRGQNIYESRREHVLRTLQISRDKLADCTSESGRKFLDEAESAYQTAGDLNAKGRVPAALRQLRFSHEMALKAAQECQGVGYLQQRYERLRQDGNALSEALKAAAGPQVDMARELLQQAFGQLDMAREHIANQRAEQAMASLKAAQMALGQAEKHLARSR